MSDDDCRCDLSKWLRPEVFKALGDPNRLTILSQLVQGGDDQSVSQVASCCTVDLSVVSRHLGLLRNAGVVESARHGKEVRYRVRVEELVGMLRGLADALESCCPDGTCTVVAQEGEGEGKGND